jgi:hypothetical protein
MTRLTKSTIDQTVSDSETLVGLAKEAAQKPLPRADVDIEYFLDLAEKDGKQVSRKEREEVWAIFTKTQSARIKRVEEAITKYRKSGSEDARNQLAWYEQELRRLKEWKPPKKD